jgi:TonB-linked SusC/RagA family outer membrane protein
MKLLIQKKPRDLQINNFPDYVVKLAAILLLAVTIQARAAETESNLPLLGYDLTVVQKVIKGRVVDDKGLPIPGANVVVKGANISTQTDFDGNFNISVTDKATKLIVSYIGMETQEVAIRNSMLIIVLKKVGESLDEVVIVGYGKQKKVNLSGAVNTVSSKAIINRPVTSLTNALQGTVPGVNIIARPGDVGGDIGTVNIRGRGNLGASEALYVVDGVPVSSGDFARINPNDVENISVLKDASASAIYGSRAAYGVILVTTKKGKAGKMTVNYNTYTASQSAIVLPKWLGAYDYANLRNEAATNAGKAEIYSPENLQTIKDQSNLDLFPDNNWYKLVLRATAPMTENQISVSGGGDTRYYVSGSIFNQNSLIPGKDLKRYSFRTNSDSKVSEKFRIGTNIAFTRDAVNNDKGNLNFVALNRMTPLVVARQSNGDWGSMNGGQLDPVLAKDNPLRALEEGGRSDSNKNRFLGSVNATLTPIKGFDISGQFSYNYYNGFDSSFINETAAIPNFLTGELLASTITSPNSHSESWNNYSNLLAQLTTSYEKNISNHYGKLLAGTSFEDNNSRYISVTRKGYITNELNSINAGSRDPLNTAASGGIGANAFQSVFGRFNYAYDNKYLFESSLRIDRSSKFAPGHRKGVFPSVSGAWRISQENFMQSVNWISELKIRGSWGKLGNISNVGDYDFYDGLSTGTAGILDGIKQDGTYPGKLANPNLSWEKVNMTNIGLDLGLWHNKLNIQLDAYDRMTNGILLVNPSLPDEAGLDGANRPSANLAKVQNKGIELSLTHNNEIGDFKYSIGGNFSRIWNKVVDLAGTGDQVSIPFINRVGEPIGSFYMLESEGLFVNAADVESHAVQSSATKAGDIKYKDQNNDGKIDNDDRTVLGSDVPYITYGLNITASYKNFDFALLGQGVTDVKVYLDSEASQAFFNGAGVKENVLDRWTTANPNPNASYPRLLSSADNSHNLVRSDFWLYNASYFRFKTISLGYSLPVSLMEKLRIERVRLYVSSNNPFTIKAEKRLKDFDPEMASTRASYPQLKTFSVGLNVSL